MATYCRDKPPRGERIENTLQLTELAKKRNANEQTCRAVRLDAYFKYKTEGGEGNTCEDAPFGRATTLNVGRVADTSFGGARSETTCHLAELVLRGDAVPQESHLARSVLLGKCTQQSAY